MFDPKQSDILRIAFLGTFHPAVPTFQLLARHGWVRIIVLPEAAGYKNDELIRAAEEMSVPWTYNIDDIDRHAPNLLLAANYPKLVPARYLDSFPCINTHWSLLPKWRGVHPTAWALINGDEEIGVTVHLMKDEFDTGPILAQDHVRVAPLTNINELHEQLAQKQAECVLEVLEDYLKNGSFTVRTQEESNATYVPQRTPDDGIIHWNWPSARIAALVKALPLPKYPGAFTYSGERKLIVLKASVVDCPPYFCTPGQVVRVVKNGPVWVKTGDTCLALEEVMFEDEGIAEIASKALKRGTKLGYDPQLEIADLKQRITELEKLIAGISKGENP